MARQSLDKIVVRLPDGLRPRLNALAAANRRSANSEAILALEAWVPAATGEGLVNHAPAAAPETGALQGANLNTNG